jgi:hypothetical protein
MEQKKTKKPLTVKQTQLKHRALQYLCVGGEFVSILTPFITLGIVNYEEWFVNENGWKVGLGGALALALMGIAVWMVAAKKEKKANITDGWITLMVGWFCVAFITLLLGSIITDISSIMMWGGLGLAGAFGLDMVSQKEKEKADAYKKAIADIQKETLEEKVRKEIQEENINRKKGLL